MHIKGIAAKGIFMGTKEPQLCVSDRLNIDQKNCRKHFIRENRD